MPRAENAPLVQAPQRPTPKPNYFTSFLMIVFLLGGSFFAGSALKYATTRYDEYTKPSCLKEDHKLIKCQDALVYGMEPTGNIVFTVLVPRKIEGKVTVTLCREDRYQRFVVVQERIVWHGTVYIHPQNKLRKVHKPLITFYNETEGSISSQEFKLDCPRLDKQIKELEEKWREAHPAPETSNANQSGSEMSLFEFLAIGTLFALMAGVLSYALNRQPASL